MSDIYIYIYIYIYINIYIYEGALNVYKYVKRASLYIYTWWKEMELATDAENLVGTAFLI